MKNRREDLTKNIILNKEGVTLVELIVVISIIAILSSIGIQSFIGYKEKVNKQVCRSNCLQLERMYESYLVLEEVGHSEETFKIYMNTNYSVVCTKNGVISYDGFKVYCSIHDNEEHEDESDVPYI